MYICVTPIPNIGNQDGLHQIFGLLHARSIPKSRPSRRMNCERMTIEWLRAALPTKSNTESTLADAPALLHQVQYRSISHKSATHAA